jgi:hypothetical protein
VDTEPVLGAGQGQQRVDEGFGLADGDPDVVCHAAQFLGGGRRLAEYDVDGRPHDGERCASFVAGIGDEPSVALEGGLPPAEHGVEGVRQLA